MTWENAEAESNIKKSSTSVTEYPPEKDSSGVEYLVERRRKKKKKKAKNKTIELSSVQLSAASHDPFVQWGKNQFADNPFIDEEVDSDASHETKRFWLSEFSADDLALKNDCKKLYMRIIPLLLSRDQRFLPYNN